MGTRRSVALYLVRHGVTKWNLEKLYLGHTDQSLLDDSSSSLINLKKFLQDIPFQVRFSSDLSRCLQTYKRIKENTSVCIDKRIREYNFGSWDGHSHDSLKDNAHYQSWLENWQTVVPPGGESYPAFHNRLSAFLNDLLLDIEQRNSVNNVLIVSHGGVIRLIMEFFEDNLSYQETKVGNGEAVKLIIEKREGEWTCSSWSVVPTQVKGNSLNSGIPN